MPAGTTELSPYVNSIVPYDDMIVNLDLQLRTSGDEGTDTSIDAGPSDRENAEDAMSDIHSAESQGDDVSEDIVNSGENFLC